MKRLIPRNFFFLRMVLHCDDFLPQKKVVPKRPWISTDTISLIEERNKATREGRGHEARMLSKRVKTFAKQDKNKWLNEALATGDWKEVRRYKSGKTPSPGRLKDDQGKLVNSEERAETLAKFLETTQWKIQFADVRRSIRHRCQICS